MIKIFEPQASGVDIRSNRIGHRRHNRRASAVSERGSIDHNMEIPTFASRAWRGLTLTCHHCSLRDLQRDTGAAQRLRVSSAKIKTRMIKMWLICSLFSASVTTGVKRASVAYSFVGKELIKPFPYVMRVSCPFSSVFSRCRMLSSCPASEKSWTRGVMLHQGKRLNHRLQGAEFCHSVPIKAYQAHVDTASTGWHTSADGVSSVLICG